MGKRKEKRTKPLIDNKQANQGQRCKLHNESLQVKIIDLPKKKIWEQYWVSSGLVILSICCSIAVAFMGWKINQQIHKDDTEFKKNSDELTRSIQKSNIDQQKISWSISLLPLLSSTDPKLQLYASLVFKDLKMKGIFPDHLLPALAKIAFDKKTDQDAANVLIELLGKEKGHYDINIGSNAFSNVLFALSLDEKRYFIIRSDIGQFFISVIVGNEDFAEFEIVNNKPISNSFSNVFLTTQHILVVSDLDNGSQVYKLDVGKEIDITYLPLDNPISIKFTPDKFYIGKSTFKNIRLKNFKVGFIVFKNGHFAIGKNNIASKAVSELYRRAMKTGDSH